MFFILKKAPFFTLGRQCCIKDVHIFFALIMLFIIITNNKCIWQTHLPNICSINIKKKKKIHTKHIYIQVFNNSDRLQCKHSTGNPRFKGFKEFSKFTQIRQFDLLLSQFQSHVFQIFGFSDFNNENTKNSARNPQFKEFLYCFYNLLR